MGNIFYFFKLQFSHHKDEDNDYSVAQFYKAMEAHTNTICKVKCKKREFNKTLQKPDIQCIWILLSLTLSCLTGNSSLSWRSFYLKWHQFFQWQSQLSQRKSKLCHILETRKSSGEKKVFFFQGSSNTWPTNSKKQVVLTIS